MPTPLDIVPRLSVALRLLASTRIVANAVVFVLPTRTLLRSTTGIVESCVLAPFALVRVNTTFDVSSLRTFEAPVR